MRTRGNLKTGGILTVVLFCVVSLFDALGWLRQKYSDDEVAARADLIVVGRLKKNSIIYYQHPGKNSWEHSALLEVTNVLKGEVPTNVINVCISYGLDPLVGGRFSNETTVIDYTSRFTNYPPDVIELFDTGNSLVGLPPVTGDLQTNHVWLLRHANKYDAHTNCLYIRDPEDVQPLSRLGQLKSKLKR
jgi:hypothetical protein